MINPASFALLLARWNVEEMYVPDSVERAVATVCMVGTVVYLGPSGGTIPDGDQGRRGYRCKACGYSCKWIYPMSNDKGSNDDGQVQGIAWHVSMRRTPSFSIFHFERLHRRHHCKKQHPDRRSGPRQSFVGIIEE